MSQYIRESSTVRKCKGDKVRNVHLGSCRKLSQAEALEKAHKLKAEALRVQPEVTGSWNRSRQTIYVAMH